MKIIDRIFPKYRKFEALCQKNPEKVWKFGKLSAVVLNRPFQPYRYQKFYVSCDSPSKLYFKGSDQEIEFKKIMTKMDLLIIIFGRKNLILSRDPVPLKCLSSPCHKINQLLVLTFELNIVTLIK